MWEWGNIPACMHSLNLNFETTHFSMKAESLNSSGPGLMIRELDLTNCVRRVRSPICTIPIMLGPITTSAEKATCHTHTQKTMRFYSLVHSSLFNFLQTPSAPHISGLRHLIPSINSCGLQICRYASYNIM